MVEQIDWSIKRGLLLADQEIEALRSAILGRNFTSVVPLASGTQQVFRADVGGASYVIQSAMGQFSGPLLGRITPGLASGTRLEVFRDANWT